MKQLIFKKIILVCVFAGCLCICNAQRLAVKSNLLDWGYGSVNLESEWISRHPFSNNIGYSISCVPSHPFHAQWWYDRRYWFSGRATIGTALGLGFLYVERSRTQVINKQQYRSAVGIQGTLIHCFTINPRWSLEAKIGVGCLRTFPEKEIYCHLNRIGISFMYIIQ